MTQNIFKSLLSSALCVATALSACNSSTEHREEFRQSLLQERRINFPSQQSNAVLPTYYQQITSHNEEQTSARIYIEGDGYAYKNKSQPSGNPTPKTPVALFLALEDNTPNVFYIARPCQYIAEQELRAKCTVKDWTTHRYSDEVIKSIDDVLSAIKLKNNIEKFELIGFSGGANIAGLLAVKRDDITSIRTVAGNVDNDFFTHHHQVSAMPYSLNMADYAPQLSSIPQIHYVSPDDRFVPPVIAQSYMRKLPNLNCAQIRTVNHTTHLEGWGKQWATLLQEHPVCK